MTFYEKIYSILAPEVSNELYPVRHPDPDGTSGDVARLFSTYTVVGGASFNKLDGDSDVERPRVQISLYSLDFDVLVATLNKFKAALKTANEVYNQCVEDKVDFNTVDEALPIVSVGTPIWGYEDDTKRYFIQADYYTWSCN